MIIVYGVRRYGAVERGLRHRIVTKFMHIYYLPLIPLGSELAMDHSGAGMDAIPVRFNGWSVLAAYLRVWGLGVVTMALIGFVGAVTTLAEVPSSDSIVPAIVSGTGLLFAVGAVLASYMLIGRISPEKKAQLAIFLQHTGFEVDPRHHSAVAGDVQRQLTHWVVGRCHGLGQSGYRLASDPQSTWMHIALDPTLSDRDLVGGAFTLARLLAHHGDPATQPQFRAAEHALWERYLQLQPRTMYG